MAELYTRFVCSRCGESAKCYIDDPTGTLIPPTLCPWGLDMEAGEWEVVQ